VHGDTIFFDDIMLHGSTSFLAKMSPPTISIQPVGERQFNLFPNPTNGWLHFSDLPENECVIIRLMDLDGRILQTERISQEKPNIDIRNHLNGVYIISLTANGLQLNRKIVLIHDR